MKTGTLCPVVILYCPHQNTLGAFSDFSFLTVSPCCETRSYRPEEAQEGEEEVAGDAAEEEAGAEGAIPGL